MFFYAIFNQKKKKKSKGAETVVARAASTAACLWPLATKTLLALCFSVPPTTVAGKMRACPRPWGKAVSWHRGSIAADFCSGCPFICPSVLPSFCPPLPCNPGACGAGTQRTCRVPQHSWPSAGCGSFSVQRNRLLLQRHRCCTLELREGTSG